MDKPSKQEQITKGISALAITGLRRDIDKIDEKILDLINQRLLLASEIGKIKAKQGDRLVDGARESTLVKRLLSLNNGPLSKHALRHIFTEIIAAAREIQTPQRVAYLGPEATFTHIAAVNHFGRSVTFAPQGSIRDVFNEVEKGAFHYGVVPVENSIEGAVNYTLDLFFESELKICAEIYYAISHDLLSIDTDLGAVRKIYSHPHAFAQCRKWLEKHLPQAALVECSSTAEAARKASGEKGTAAIASQEAAQSYKLEVMASRIEDASRNVTRFLVIGKDDIHQTGADKTSIMFVTSHVPGALFKVLKPIADANINMVKLESRPSKHENWSYFFFVDLEGHISDTKVKETVDHMKKLCLFLKLLGSYPMSEVVQKSVQA
ncbi:MAG: prephenate dehydratase [Desulfobacterales bacterium]|nr:prephenate dehydratase [Desulfobacterales bacterium]